MIGIILGLIALGFVIAIWRHFSSYFFVQRTFYHNVARLMAAGMLQADAEMAQLKLSYAFCGLRVAGGKSIPLALRTFIDGRRRDLSGAYIHAQQQLRPFATVEELTVEWEKQLMEDF